MSKGNIRGITIDFDGNTTKLDKALSDVDKRTTDVNKELRQVDSLLKFNPGNTDLIAQKQSLLAKQIQNTSDRLGTLKQVQSQVDAQFKSGDLGEEEYRAFQREVVATEGKLKSYQGQLAASKTSQTSLESSTKQLSSYFEASGKSVTDFADVLGPKLTSAIAEGRASSAELNTAINKIGRTVTSNSADFDKFKAALKGIDDGGSIDALRSDLKGLDTQADTTGDALGGISKKLDTSNLMEAADGLSGITDKASELGGQVIETVTSLQDFQSQAQRSFGMSASEAKNLGSVVENVMQQGIVPDVNDAGEAVLAAKNYFGDLNNADLSSVSNKVAGLNKTFGVDFTDSAKSAKVLMDHFGLSADQAFDYLTAGFQNGLNNSDDFLDTINEYSPLMQTAGLSAKDFTDILAKGMKGGAMNTDKVADAVKEFQIRLGDGTFEGNLGSFSNSTKTMFKQWQGGKATVKDVMDSVGKDLKKMDPSEQQAALSLLGTQFEDLGKNATLALFDTKGGLDKVTGSAKDLSKQSPGEKLAGSLAKLKSSLAEMVEPLIEGIKKLIDAFNKMSPAGQKVVTIAAAIAAGIAVIAPIIASIITIIGGVSSAIGAIGAAATTAGGFMALLTGTILPIIGVIAGVIAAIVAIIAVIKNWGSIVKWLKGVWSGITGFFSSLWTGIQNVFNTSMTAITTFIKTTWTGISTFFSGLWDGIKNIFNIALNGIVAFVTPIFTSIANVITTIWNGIKTFFTVIWDGIKAVFTVAITAIAVIIGTQIEIWKAIITTAMNLIKAVITTIWNGIKAFFGPILAAIGNVISTAWNAISTTTSNVFNAVKTFLVNIWNSVKAILTPIINGIKNFISGVWNSIKSVTSSVFNAIKSFLSSIWNGIKSLVSSAVNAVKSAVTSAWNGIKSISSSVWNSIKSVISGVWNGIKSAVSSAVNSVRSTVSGVWNGIKSVTRSVWNGIKNAITGPMNAAKNVIRGIINAIKGFFNFHISWPHIPMPHFGISPSGWKIGDLLKGSIPHLSVAWHAAGGIFNKPTLFANGGQVHGVGEAGAEAVAPLDKLMGYVKKAVAEEMANAGTTNVTVNVLADTSNATIKKIKAAVVEGITKDNKAHKLAIGGA
ncbi:phage tail protein [Lacticaseibacillus sp. N501-2]|uniref:phage tail protein n=1 Tax=Lacticaseibacillus salsurae TaxID=3367729 RepID=UPI0038B252DC